MPRRSRSSGAQTGPTTPKRSRHSDRNDSGRSLRDTALGGADQPGRRIAVSTWDMNEKNRALKAIEGTKGSELKAYAIDLHVPENSKAHRTEEYEHKELVARRGQGFKVTITFNRSFQRLTDKIILQLTTGAQPQESKETLLRLALEFDMPQDKGEDWHIVYQADNEEEKTVDIQVICSADCIIGRYGIFVESSCEGDDGASFTHRRVFDDTFIVLFNAWCKDDQVYMEDEKARNEYVLNDRGRIWQGTRFSHAATPWNFGQFEEMVLEAALYLLDKAELLEGARSNPIEVTRCISAVANSNDGDSGVLTGRWTDDYPRGSTVPWAWTGSVAILEEYMKTKKAVRYGQCWVFSGLVTTLCRTLGIPTRSVTNFESAHDTDASMTIDYHWDVDDEPLTDLNDSVWNFHVWNESYFTRPDLPDGYEGWQAHDATPQELSAGVMRCGPCPVKAIKEGHVYLPHDAPFIFAEVNGDKVHWLVREDGSMEVLDTETHAVGCSISTKAVGSNDQDDITAQYKHPEGSADERRAVHRAFRYSSRRKHRVYEVKEPDVSFDLVTPDKVTLGDDFMVKVILKNQAEEPRTLTVRLTAITAYYTGVPAERVGTKVFQEQLAPGAEKTCELEITAEMYEEFLKPDSMVTIYMKGHVTETKKAYAKTKSFHVDKPQLVIDVPERVSIGEEFDVTIKFTNPLAVKLTGAVFHIEAPGIVSALTVPYKKPIAASEEFTYTLSLVPRRSGTKEVSINFTSDQLTGLTGVAEVYVSYSAL